MKPDQWEAIRHQTIDQTITGLKLSDSAVLMLNGKTTPDQLPFVVIVAVDKNARGLTEMMFDFGRRLERRGSPMQAMDDNAAGWAALHRAELQAKKELGKHASSLKLISRMLELLEEWKTEAK